MRHLKIWPVMCLLLMLAGCSTTPISTATAIGYVADSYDHLYPAGGDVEILAKVPHRSGMLVLAKKNIQGDSEFIDLFMVEPDGVKKIAAGLAARDKLFSINRVREGSSSIVFGHFAHNEKHRVARAVLTQQNSEIYESDVAEQNGYILVAGQGRLESFDLYRNDGEPAGHFDNRNQILDTAFVAADEVPLPAKLSGDDIAEVRVQPQSHSVEERVLPPGHEHVQNLVRVYNMNYEEMIPSLRLPEQNASVAAYLHDGKRVVFSETGAGLMVTFQKGEQARRFELTSEQLKDVLRTIKGDDGEG